MTKKEFLEALSKKLKVLDEKERQDIINEYTDIINEKVKHGQIEKDAVKDFGNIDDLVKEILEAYKINPDYEDKNQKENKNIIEQWAEKLASTTSDLIDRFKTNNNLNLNLVFEIIIKVFVVLILLGVINVFMEIFRNLGSSLFDSFLDPIDGILTAFWSIFLLVIYIVIAVIIICAMFKQYFEKNEKQIKNKETKPKTKNQPKTENTKEIKKSNISDIILLIIKVLIILYVIIPMIFINCFNIFGLIVAIVYLIKGINLWGLCILLIGLISLITLLIKLILNLMFDKVKPHIIPFITSITLIALGTFMFIDMIMSVEYINDIPKNTEIKEEVKEFKTDKPVYLNIHTYKEENVIKTINNNLEDNKFIIKVSYPEYVEKMEFDQIDNYRFSDYCETKADFDEYIEEKCNDNNLYNHIIINAKWDDEEFNNFKKFYNDFINNLKDNKFYNYNKLYDNNSLYKIEIEANENTLSKIYFE